MKNKGGSAYYWWERSPQSGNGNYFCSIYSNGDAYDPYYANDSNGVAFGFCV